MGELLSFPSWSRKRKIANLESEYAAWMALRERWGSINDLIEHLNQQYWLDGHEFKIQKEKK